ncbi:serine/threonine-protein kinase [Streptomyces sp. NPDC127190]|uniref:serine/threonine-protein kinase n=1 Tax=unclassified Streptomyces TaxID=2593676 RepID=UPI0036347F54
MGTEGADCRVIAGRYRLEARIGRGGMGVVWRASDQVLGRRVAVKELLGDDAPAQDTRPEGDARSAGDPRAAEEARADDEARRRRDRILREARAVAQLSHPHIVVVHDVVEQGGRPYLVMELIDGGSLADRIARQGPVDAAEAARIGIALLSAVRTAHEAGVLHRDIKPANVLIESGTGRVVLTDFGIAQVSGATTLTETGSFVGSPEYTAPERMAGLRSGPESDLWSLGALLCTALSGESPFRRDSLGGILHAVVTDDIRPPAQAEPLLPVVRGLLERDPDRRLRAAEAEEMLRAYLETGRTPQAPGVAGSPPAGHGHRFGDAVRAVKAAAHHPPTERDLPHHGSSPHPPAEQSPARSSTRGVLIAALLVAALAGAGVSAATLLLHGRGGGGGGTPGGTATAPATSPGTSGSGPSSPTATGTRRPGSTGPGATASHAAVRPAPSGYRTAHDPAGFSLAVPQDFVRSPEGERVFYLSPGETYRLGVRAGDPQPGGPQAVMEASAANGPATNPGYRDGRVTATTHHGHPAALWEFTWDGFSAAQGPRHTYDLCWEEGGRLYDVWVSAPVGRVREAREYFDVAVDTFTATGD